VARQTRSERRARRAAQQDSQAVAQRPRPRPQQQQLRPTAEPAAVDGGRRLPGSGFRNFVLESWGELKKVDWPGQQQLIQGTAVVLIACLITGVYLFLADQVFKRFVQHVLLGG
jgi:preprotein translocase SecE subunit